MRSFLFGILGGAVVLIAAVAVAALAFALMARGGAAGDALTAAAAEDAFRVRGYTVTAPPASPDWFAQKSAKPKAQRAVAGSPLRPGAVVYEFASTEEAARALKETSTGGVAAPVLYQNENLLLYVSVFRTDNTDNRFEERIIGIFYALR